MDYKEHLVQVEKEKDTRKPHWVPPAGDGIKININGSFLSETKSGGWDFVIRDAQGDSMGAAAGHIDSAHDALQTEAVAYMKAMEAAQQWGMVHVVLETDAQLLANAMNSDDDDLP
jgi:ribonuclease HI